MRNESSQNNSLGGFLDRIRGWILGFIAVVSGLYGVIKLLQGDLGLVSILCLVVASTILLLVSLYGYFKRAPPLKAAGFSHKGLQRKYQYSRSLRLLAFVGIVGIPLVAGSVFLRWRYPRNLPSEKTVILVANFQSLDGQSYGITEKIIEQLREETRQYADIEVSALGNYVTAQEGSGRARAIAKENKAAIFLWGWYRKAQENVLITVHFEVLQKPIDLRLRTEKQELILPSRGMESFQIQTRLSREMAYLTLLTIGLARLESGQYLNAISLFNKAIEQTAVPEELIDPANIYYFRGNAYMGINSYREAVADFTESLRITPENFCTACALNNRGVAYSRLSNLDSALADLNESQKHNSAEPAIHYNIGLIYQAKGDFDNAIKAYTEAINRDSNFIDAYRYRADLFLSEKSMKRRLGTATRYFNMSLTIGRY